MHRRNYIVAGTLVGLLMIAIGDCVVCPSMPCSMTGSSTAVICTAQMCASPLLNRSHFAQKGGNSNTPSVPVYILNTLPVPAMTAFGVVFDTGPPSRGSAVPLYEIDRSLRI